MEVLPRPIPIVNERKAAMKKMMMAVGVAAMVAAGCQLCDEPKPEVYSRSFVGMDKATVMFEWAKAWQELDKPKERDKIGLEVFVDDKNAWRRTYVKIPVGANEEAMREIVSATLEEAPFKDSKRWESFDLALADCGWWTFDLQLEYRRLAVSFDANGIVTNQCEITRTFRDAL